VLFRSETARAGSASGEATTVLRTLPARTRRRLPLRVAHPGWLAVAALIAVAAAVVLAILLSGHTKRGTGTQGATRTLNLTPVSLQQKAAKDYDPYGTGGEHPEETGLVVDRDVSTFWTTERYDGGLGSKPGVGIYVDASPGVAARALEIRTPEPGFTAAVYAADSGPPKDISGWKVVAPARTVTEQRTRFDIAQPASHRYYLLWITKLPKGQAKISEIYLFK